VICIARQNIRRESGRIWMGARGQGRLTKNSWFSNEETETIRYILTEFPCRGDFAEPPH